MSLFYGYEDKTQKDIENLDDNKLSINGGKMKGNKNMNLYAIRKNPDPTFDDQLVRKKHVDGKFLTITNFRKQMVYSIINDFLLIKFLLCIELILEDMLIYLVVEQGKYT